MLCGRRLAKGGHGEHCSQHFKEFKRFKSRSHDCENDAIASATVLHVAGVSPPLREVEQITRLRPTEAVESGTLAGAIMMRQTLSPKP